MLRVLRLATAVALLAGTAVSGLSASAAPTVCGPGGSVEAVGPYWLALRPSFPAGDAEVTLAAVPAFDPNLLYATNGTVVMRSTDAGCGWEPFWSVTSLGSPAPLTTPRVTALHVPSSANNSRFLYLGVTTGVDVEQAQDLVDLSPRVVVLSEQRGKRVTTVAGPEQGLPPLGAVREVVANAQVPQVGYAVVEEPGAGRQLYATSDAGLSWTRRSSPGAPVEATGLSVHPTVPTQLFGLDGTTVAGSEDGGASFAPLGLSAKAAALSAAPGAGGVKLTVAVTGEAAVEESTNGGRAWRRRESPVVATSVAQVPVQTARVALADAGSVWLLSRQFRQDISPPGAAPRLIGVSTPTATGFSVTGVREGALLQVALDFQGTPQRPPTVNGVLRPVSLHPRGRTLQFPSTLAPQGLRVELPAGGSTTVPYGLLVPRTPAPVDVMFLLDSTGSMASVFDSLRQGIAAITDSLDAAGLDGRFGLGDFRDYPSPYGRASPGDWPYRLDRTIGPADAELEAAIESVEAGGGTDDGGASPLTAVVQSTTGAGEAVEGRELVRPGLQAGYRRGALKLALVVHDTFAHEGGERLGDDRVNPGPTFESAIATLRRHGVHAMGLAISPQPEPGLRRLARGSDTLAPAGGVDCDGDGRVDVAAGEPLVCVVDSLGLPTAGTEVPVETVGVAPAVVGLAAGIADIKPVSLRLAGGGSLVTVASPASRPVNLRTDNELAFTLSLRCPRERAASRHEVEVTARTPLVTLARTTLTLDCGSVGQVSPELPVALAAAAAGPAAPAQGAPNPNPNPHPNPHPNPNPAPNVNANPGAAHQDETEEQLAFAEGERETQVEMSAVRSGVFVGTAALMLCAAVAVAHPRREQEQSAG